jgi:uncharacterized protein
VSIELIIFLIVFGYVVGILSALLGVGGGIFMVPVLVLIAGLGQQEAQATSLLVVVPTAIAGTWRLRRAGIADLAVSTKIGVLGVAGGAVGALLALQLSGVALRFAFAALLIIVGIRLLIDAKRMGNTPGDGEEQDAQPPEEGLAESPAQSSP